MKYKQSMKNIFTAVLAFCLFVSVIMGGWQMLPAYAATSAYSDVLLDLQVDSEFNADDYPNNASDYTIQLIQIAESKSGELFVYTYQPSQISKYLVATEINMSLSDSASGTKLYSLTLLNCNRVFCKYKVNDIAVNAETTRYYNITSIYRDWDKEIDEETGNDNTKNSVAYPVGKLFAATTENGNITYGCTEIQTIQIINPYADYLEYSNGFKFCPNWCHSHYVAFSTDKKIDTLMEADVSYRSPFRLSRYGFGIKRRYDVQG